MGLVKGGRNGRCTIRQGEVGKIICPNSATKIASVMMTRPITPPGLRSINFQNFFMMQTRCVDRPVDKRGR